MTTQMQGGSAGEAIKALSGILPLLTGSSSKETSTTTVDPNATNALTSLIASLSGKASGKGTAGYEDLLADLQQQMKIAMLSSGVKNNNNIGLYNNSALPSIDALIGAQLSKATAGTILQDRAQAGATAGRAAGDLATASRNTSRVTTQQANPLAQLLGAATTGYSIYDKFMKPATKTKVSKEDFANSLNMTDESLGAAGDINLTNSIRDSFDFGSDVYTSSSAAGNDAFNSAVFSGPVDDATTYALSGLDSFLSSSAGVNAGADFAANFGADVFTEAAGNLAGDAAIDVGAEFAANFGADVFGDFAGDAAAEVAGEAVGSSFGFPGAYTIASTILGDDGLDISVICTEAKRQGLMSAELHRKESLDYYPTLSAPLVSGYHFLAKPAVTLMRKNKVAARFFASGATAYAKHTTGDKNLLGCIIKNLGEPLCYLAGKTLSLFLATPLALKAS